MSNALSDVVVDGLSRGYVEQRVQDWVDRVEKLFDLISAWLPDDWLIERTKVVMDEEMMRQHKVTPRELPLLNLRGPGEVAAEIRPYGLWVIGANGRLDLDSPAGRFAVFDRADSDLDRPKPRWMIAPLRDRTNPRTLRRRRSLRLSASERPAGTSGGLRSGRRLH